MKKLLAISATLAWLASGAAHATVYTGAMDNRASAPFIPGLVAQSLAWATGGSPGGGLRLEWQADDESHPGFWTYSYRLLRDSARSKGFAYFDIETAADFTSANLKTFSVVSATDRSGLPILSGLASIGILGPVAFDQPHDFSNAPVTEADFRLVLNKSDLSHYSGDPGRVPPGQPGGRASATASVGPVPHPFFGLRVSFPGSFVNLAYEACAWEFQLVTDRTPMWGSFFGWGDQTAVAPFWYANVYNDRLGQGARLALAPADSPDGAPPYRGWILVPGPLPAVVASRPRADARDGPVSGALSVSFNVPMDPATLTAESFTVSGATGQVAYDPASLTASFLPDEPLTGAVGYSASLSAAVRDRAGNPLQPTSWNFRTLPDGLLLTAAGQPGVADALQALRISVGLVQPSPEQAARGDVAPLGADGRPRPDGRINLLDAITILRRSVGLIDW